MTDGLDVYLDAFLGWVGAFNAAYGTSARADDLLNRLRARGLDSTWRHIGEGLRDGWLAPVTFPGREYQVRRSDHRDSTKGHSILLRSGTGCDPSWELHVQLADYVRLRSVGEPLGFTVRMEDHLMDVTVYAGQELLLYVENKTSAAEAIDLLNGMMLHTSRRTSFDRLPATLDDPLKKCLYILAEGARPRYFGLSAAGYWRLLQVEYLSDPLGFCLHPMPEHYDITWPLLNDAPPIVGTPREESPIDPLALELTERLPDQAWIVPGQRKSAFNVRVDLRDGRPLMSVLGLYKDNTVWSYVTRLGEPFASRYVTELARHGIDVERKDWTAWQRNGSPFRLQDGDPAKLVDVIERVFFGKHA